MAKKVPLLRFQSEESRNPGLLAAALRGDGTLGERIKEYSKEDSDKLLLLCEHYGIQSSSIMFYELALALAREIYPEPKKRGRKSKWTVLNQGALVVEIERLVRPNDLAHGVEWACNQLSKREPWASFLEARGCKNFCVNGHLAGDCRATRSEDDRTKESCTQGITG